jgi:MYXO-CTERM domain-containing protein
MLTWNHNLGLAAHWHAQHMHDGECFQHQTCCFLVNNGGVIECDSQGITCNPPGQCDYTPDCPGTGTWARIGMFGGSATGENIAAGNSTALDTLCQWYFSSGHHDNMCSGSHGSLGVGYFGGSNCWNHYWVQDFGSHTPPDGPVSGSHWGNNWFGAAYNDPGASGPPQRSVVVIDGVCHDMTLEFGNNGAGTYAAQISVGAGCHAYWFLFNSNTGTRFAYPTTGSYMVGTGCGGNYTSDQAGADCEGGTQNCNPGDSRACYEGPVNTQNVGECSDGTQNCVGGTYGPCQGQTLPQNEVCDGLDNDCNGTTDDPCDCTVGQTMQCGSDVGECETGTQTCQAGGNWGPCQNDVGPTQELCDGLDNDCDGVTDNNCIPSDGGLPPDSSVNPGDGGGTTGDGGGTTGDGGGFDDGIQGDRLWGGCQCRSAPTGQLPATPFIVVIVLGALAVNGRRRRKERR